MPSRVIAPNPELQGFYMPELQIGVNFVIFAPWLNHLFSKRLHKVHAL